MKRLNDRRDIKWFWVAGVGGVSPGFEGPGLGFDRWAEGKLTHSSPLQPLLRIPFRSEAQSVMDSALVEVSNDEHCDSHTF